MLFISTILLLLLLNSLQKLNILLSDQVQTAWFTILFNEGLQFLQGFLFFFKGL